MSLRASRIGRPGVIEQPVARTPAVAGSAEAIARGVERRQDDVPVPPNHERPTA
jgi:hypothetical protein